MLARARFHARLLMELMITTAITTLMPPLPLMLRMPPAPFIALMPRAAAIR